MKQVAAALLILALVAGGADAVLAQGGPGPGRGGYGRIYDPKTVETVLGEVQRVDRVAWGQKGQGVHLVLNTGKETLSVHLGPKWFLDRQPVKIMVKDRIQVTGSRVDFQGQPALIAAEVKKDGQVLLLRNPQGVPVWAGQGRGRRQYQYQY